MIYSGFQMNRRLFLKRSIDGRLEDRDFASPTLPDLPQFCHDVRSNPAKVFVH